MFVSENSQQLVGKIDPVNTKQVVSHLGNENRAQVVPQLGKHFRKQSLSSPRRGNETLAFVGKLDSVNLENGIRAQIMLQLGKRLRKQSLSSPRRGNESLAQGIALGIIAQTNNVLKGQKHYRYVTITL